MSNWRTDVEKISRGRRARQSLSTPESVETESSVKVAAYIMFCVACNFERTVIVKSEGG